MNPYEIKARAVKVDRMSASLRHYGISEADARKLTDHEWHLVAVRSNCPPPKSQATKDAVYAALADQSAPVRMSVLEWNKEVEEVCPI